MIIDLGLFLALMTPVNTSDNNVCTTLTRKIEEIDRQAREAQQQLEVQLASEEFQQQVQEIKHQIEEQLNGLLQDESKLEQFLQHEGIQPDLVAALNAARENPNSNVIEEFLNQKIEHLPDLVAGQIRERRDELVQNLQLEFQRECD
jgi:malate synthase